MELRRDPAWSTRAGRRKFVTKTLKKHYEYLTKKAKTPAEVEEGKRLLGLTRNNLRKIVTKPTSWKPTPPSFDIPFIRDALKDVEHGAEVVEWLKDGVPLALDATEVEEKVKQNFNTHSCFRNPLAIYN